MESGTPSIPPLSDLNAQNEIVFSDRVKNATVGATAGVTAGAAIGSAAVLGGFLLVGLTPVGPVAGSLFAANMGAGVAAGSYMAATQAAAMSTWAYYTGATALGAAGGIAGGWAGYWYDSKYNKSANRSSYVNSGNLQEWGRNWYAPKTQAETGIGSGTNNTWAEYLNKSKLYDSRAWINYLQEKQWSIGNWSGCYWYGSNKIKSGESGQKT